MHDRQFSLSVARLHRLQYILWIYITSKTYARCWTVRTRSIPFWGQFLFAFRRFRTKKPKRLIQLFSNCPVAVENSTLLIMSRKLEDSQKVLLLFCHVIKSHLFDSQEPLIRVRVVLNKNILCKSCGTCNPSPCDNHFTYLFLSLKKVSIDFL